MESLDNFLAKQRRRNAQNQGALDLAAQQHTVSGEFLVVGGVGEVKAQTLFPVKFIEMPSFYSGVRIPASNTTFEGDMPYANVVACNWIIESPDPSTSYLRVPRTKLYVGCDIGVITHGPAGTKLIINWNFTGVGIASITE
jgi:hypothetical protein